MTSTSGSERGASRALLVPADLAGPSGGNHYNARVRSRLCAAGVAVAEERIRGAWPHAADDDRRALRRALGRHRDVVVDGIIASAAPAELAWARDRGVRVAVLLHLPLAAELGDDAGERVRLSASEGEALQIADTVVATSRWAREDLRGRYGLTGVHAVAPGSDIAPSAAGSTPPHLLFLGSVTHRKNPLGLLEALAPLRDRRWTLSLVGPPAVDQAYTEAVRTCAATFGGRVRLTGALRGEALEKVWRTVDLLVLPSTTETYGMVVTEALAHGIPALVTGGTGAVEALRGSGERDGLPDPGTVVDTTAAAGWTTALSRWLEDGDLRHDWRLAASAHRARLRGWGTTADELRTALGW